MHDVHVDIIFSGKSVGVVTTDSVVGASPSGAYAHVASRDWRVDSTLPQEAEGICKDITRQLVEDNLDIQVRKDMDITPSKEALEVI